MLVDAAEGGKAGAALPAPHRAVIPLDLAGVIHQPAVNRLPAPLRGDVAGVQETALRGLSTLVGEGEALVVLIDGTRHGVIAVAVPGSLKVRHAMAAPASSSATNAIAARPERSVRPINSVAIPT